jgi:hypothetical protein
MHTHACTRMHAHAQQCCSARRPHTRPSLTDRLCPRNTHAGGLLSGALFQYPGALIMTGLGVASANVLQSPPDWCVCVCVCVRVRVRVRVRVPGVYLGSVILSFFPERASRILRAARKFPEIPLKQATFRSTKCEKIGRPLFRFPMGKLTPGVCVCACVCVLQSLHDGAFTLLWHTHIRRVESFCREIRPTPDRSRAALLCCFRFTRPQSCQTRMHR